MDKISKLPRFALLLLIFLFPLSCTNGKIDQDKVTNRTDVFDRQTGITKRQVKDFFVDKKDKNSDSSSTALKPVEIPQSSKLVAIPTPPKVNQQKLISFSVTDQVPLKDVLIELAKVAKLDIDLDPGISGGVIINAKNRPLVEVLDRICDMGNLRYSFENNLLKVEQDSPFVKNYLVDFLIDGELWTQVESNVSSIVSNNSSTSSASSTGSSSSSISSNKPAGILTVFANSKVQSRVTEYLEKVRKNASTQVLIEAKVVEVKLSDDFKTGIDWDWASKTGETVFNQSGGGVDSANPISLVLNSKSLFGGNINSTISALEKFGIVKAIASPRINALNNQKATLNFTEKLIYFTNDASTTSTTSSSSTNTQNAITSTQHEETTGTELTITPSIDLANNEITLKVQPKITVQNGKVTQNLTVVTNTETGETTELQNDIPIINTRELNTTAKIKSGNILVIGGVMNENSDNTDTGLPFLSRIPLLGYLFKKVNRTSDIKETVIFVKATIIKSTDSVNKYDRDLHEKFNSSARPFFKNSQ